MGGMFISNHPVVLVGLEVPMEEGTVALGVMGITHTRKALIAIPVQNFYGRKSLTVGHTPATVMAMEGGLECLCWDWEVGCC